MRAPGPTTWRRTGSALLATKRGCWTATRSGDRPRPTSNSREEWTDMAFSPINDRYAEQRRHAENKGRLAHAYTRVNTSGSGTYEFEDCIEFGLTFVERPF